VPTLLSWTQSVFVTDLKGELYELTAGWRREHAHNRILRFEPAAAAGFESTQETPNQGPENGSGANFLKCMFLSGE